eukprot:gene4438-7813_t
MPVVNIEKDKFFKSLGKTYSNEEFEKICFEFGVEVEFEHDKEKKTDMVKIEVAANRYDLLCEEGIVQALQVFLEFGSTPEYKVIESKKDMVMTVKSETKQIRPFIVCAVLRGVKFTEENYKSFIDLQDKLHHNICRKRTLVAIGTHDLSTLTPPFTYEAKSPKDISFIPLNKTKEYRSDELLNYFETNEKETHIKPYVSIIKDSSVYPVIYDSKRVLLSLPPIINSEHSKITLNTKDVFIEATATDLTKANIVLNVIVSAFSKYSSTPFTIEQVKINYENKVEVTPNFKEKEFEIKLNYINQRIGVTINIEKASELLKKMQLKSEIKDKETLKVFVPGFRSDILHACDIMEDIAIAYGYNNILKTQLKVVTNGKQQPLNKLTSMLSHIIANAGYYEILTLALNSKNDNFKSMRKDEKVELKNAVQLSNPKSSEYQIVRTSLIPGLLKTLANNLKSSLPIKLFEINDICLINSKSDVGASNYRYLSALYCNTKAELEIIHGLLDRLMESLNIQNYEITPANDERFFKGRQANIVYENEVIGIFGILHPEVLQNFGIRYPCSVIELNIEKLKY